MSEIVFICPSISKTEGPYRLTQYIAIAYFVHLKRMIFLTDPQGTN